MRFAPLLIGCAGLLAAAPVFAGGSVEVKFDHPADFADVGRGSVDIERNVKILHDHLQTYARRLPDGQTLHIDVLDVDLAGQLRQIRDDELRVLNGRADWPRMKLRWTLSAGSRTLKSGDETLTDISYFFGSRGVDRGEALIYDRRMLDRWFSERVLAAGPQ